MNTQKHTIETERLILRPAAVGDAEAMYRNWANDPEVTKYLTWPPHKDVAETEKLVSLWASEFEKGKCDLWMIELKELGEVIGTVGMGSRGRAGAKELGYCIGRRWWNQGIMSEAVSALIEYLFTELGVSRVEARCDSRNENSGRVMLHCGMVYEGKRRQGDRNNQGVCDEMLYGILKEDWEALKRG